MESQATIEKEPQTAILRIIAAFKLFKAILLLLIGLAAIRILHHDIGATAHRILEHIRSDPNSKFLHGLISRISGIPPHRLEWFGVGAFVYSALYFTEGIGLLLVKRWAEWMAVITTGGFIPLEVYEAWHHPHWLRIIVLLVNVAIVVYLVKEIVHKSSKRRRANSGSDHPGSDPSATPIHTSGESTASTNRSGSPPTPVPPSPGN